MKLPNCLTAWTMGVGLLLLSGVAGGQQSSEIPAATSQYAAQGGEAPHWDPNSATPAFNSNAAPPTTPSVELPRQIDPAMPHHLPNMPADSPVANSSTPDDLPTTGATADEQTNAHAENPAAPSDAPAEPRPLVSVLKNKPDVLPIGPDPAATSDPISQQPGRPIYDPNVTQAQGTLPAHISPAGSRYQNLMPPGTTPPRAASLDSIGSPSAPVEAELPEPTVPTTPSVPSVSATASSTPDKLAARAATDLLATSLKPMESARPLTLVEALSRVYEQNRLPVVRAYWRLSQASSKYHWAIDEQTRLEQAVPSRSAVDSPMLSTARAAAAARVNDAKLAYLAAEAELLGLIEPQQVLGTSATGKVYPVDLPLVGAYQTHFQTIFANRTVPANLRQINEALPVHLQVINDRAAAVQAAAGAVHTAEQSHGRGEADMRTVLACHEALHQQRIDFLEAVNHYNVSIVEYAVGVASPNTPSERFAGMLIHTKQPDRVSALPNTGVSAPAAARPGTTSAATTRTRESDGWVPSNLRSLDPRTNPPPASLVPPTASATPATPPATVSPAAPATRPADPFGTPGVGDRYRGTLGR